MTQKRLATIAFAAVAVLVGAAPGLADSTSPSPMSGKGLQVEQLGPKHLLGRANARTQSTMRATVTTAVAGKTLQVERLGPKHLLGAGSAGMRSATPNTATGFDWPLAAIGSGVTLLLVAAVVITHKRRRRETEPGSASPLNV